MEVIKTNAWSGDLDPGNGPESSMFFGFRDLTSDYYQVLIQNERPRWCKIFWAVIIVGLLLFTGYVTYLMVADYNSNGSFDSYDTVECRWDGSGPLACHHVMQFERHKLHAD